jgi:hypothetical protein
VRALKVVLAAAVLLVTPSTTLAQVTLPVGRAHGVRLVHGKHGLVIVFTKRAAGMWRQIRGKRVEIDCTDEPPPDQGPPRAHAFLGPHHPGEIVEVSGGGVTMRAPKHGRRLRTGDLTRGLDYCRVWLARHTIRHHRAREIFPRRLIVSVPITQIGAVFLDEESKAGELMGIVFIAGFIADDLKIRGWPSYAQLIAAGTAETEQGIVELVTPEDTPPARKIGYYSDRADHLAVVMLSRAGRRLLIELDGDVFTSNLTGYIFNDR